MSPYLPVPPPPCPPPPTLSPAALVDDLLKAPAVRSGAGAGWSSWETWSTCSQSCAKGYRTRRRSCSGPEGKSAPAACRGSPVEYQDCNVQACPGEEGGGWGAASTTHAHRQHWPQKLRAWSG